MRYKTVPNLRVVASPHGVLMLPKKNIDSCKKTAYCPIAQNFLLVGPYFQCLIFGPQWPLPLVMVALWSRADIMVCPVVSSSFFFFSSPNLSRRRLHVCHTSTHAWCGLSANFRCRFETCCTRLAENTGRKKAPKIAIWAPSHNFVGLCLRN